MSVAIVKKGHAAVVNSCFAGEDTGAVGGHRIFDRADFELHYVFVGGL